jgi:hypothetical protein
MTLVSCKNKEQQNQPKLEEEAVLVEDSLNILEGFEFESTMSGEFIYSGSSAVFKKGDIVYGVVMNEKAKELIEKAKEVNPDPFASFDVTLEVVYKEIDNKDRWPQVIIIQNIISVKPLSEDDSLRLNK